MKRLTAVAALVGLVLFAVLVMQSGVDDILESVRSAGWGTAWVVVLRGLAIAGAGLGWYALFPPGGGMTARVAMLVRWVREGINQLLPVAAIGGDLLGARLATLRGVDGALAWASIAADVAVQAGTQLVFAVLGLVLLVWLVGDSEFVHYLAGGMVLAAAGVGAFFLLQQRGGSRLFTALGRRFAAGRDWAGLAAVERFYQKLGEIYAQPRGVATSVTIHMLVWLLGSLEVWVALHFMGYPVTIADALVIESLSQAVRGAAFAVPGGLGVQEGGFIALCALFGVPAGPAVALSLVKRVADLALGLPSLLAWQSIEGRRVLRGSGRDRSSTDGASLADVGR